MEQLKFTAEIKEVNSKKTASNDVGYKVVLFTDDSRVLSLGVLDGDTLVNVSVEVQQ